jgi:uncharacterized membrane protein (DUF4010 family)
VNEQGLGLIDGAIATGLGLFIGLEREHSEAEPAQAHTPDGAAGARRDQLGVRTFALVSLLGWLCGALEPHVRGFTLVALGAACVLLGLRYVRVVHEGAGITTEVAALVTFGLGLLVRQSRLLAVALALVVTLLLIAKPWVRSFVARIERRELTATLQLAIMLAIVLPLLPNHPVDPWGALAPRKVGLFVVLIAGISFVGYVLSRLFGARRGTGLSGLLGGLVSSTAVTAAMAARARGSEAMIVPAQLATFLANAVMFGRVIVVSAVMSAAVARRLAVPMTAMGLVMLAGALWKRQTLRKGKGDAEGEVPLANPFALLPALEWGLLLAGILVLTAVANRHFGTRGLLVASAVSGFADVDAIDVAVSRQAAAETLPIATAVLAITTATMSNTISKGVIAIASGGWRFGRDVALVFAVALTVGLLSALLAR